MTSNYQWNAADYAQNSPEQYRWALELLDKLSLRGDESLLDIGSGDGRFTALIAGRLGSGTVTGIDASADMVAHATSGFPPDRHPNLRFLQADAREMTFEHAFDLVFSNAALHWIRDHRPVLRRIARALRTGGRMLVQMGGQGNAAGMVSAMDAVRERAEWRYHFKGIIFPYGFHGLEEYGEWLVEAGLTPTRMELIPKDMRHKGVAGLASWLRTTWLPYVNRVPADRRETFINQVVQHYTARYPADKHGGIHVAMIRLEVEAFREP